MLTTANLRQLLEYLWCKDALISGYLGCGEEQPSRLYLLESEFLLCGHLSSIVVIGGRFNGEGRPPTLSGVFREEIVVLSGVTRNVRRCTSEAKGMSAEGLVESLHDLLVARQRRHWNVAHCCCQPVIPRLDRLASRELLEGSLANSGCTKNNKRCDRGRRNRSESFDSFHERQREHVYTIVTLPSSHSPAEPSHTNTNSKTLLERVRA